MCVCVCVCVCVGTGCPNKNKRVRQKIQTLIRGDYYLELEITYSTIFETKVPKRRVLSQQSANENPML